MRFIAIIFLAGIIVSCQPGKPGTYIPGNPEVLSMAKSTDSTPVFIHVLKGSRDEERLMIALSDAEWLSHYRDIYIYMDIDAVYMVARDNDPVVLEPYGDSHKLIDNLLAGHAHISVCPTCLKNAGFNREDVIDGVTVASTDSLFFPVGKNIETLTY